MKDKKSELKRQPYAAPKSEIIEIGMATVLCGSAMNGNSTESVSVSGFDWI